MPVLRLVVLVGAVLNLPGAVGVAHGEETAPWDDSAMPAGWCHGFFRLGIGEGFDFSELRKVDGRAGQDLRFDLTLREPVGLMLAGPAGIAFGTPRGFGKLDVEDENGDPPWGYRLGWSNNEHLEPLSFRLRSAGGGLAHVRHVRDGSRDPRFEYVFRPSPPPRPVGEILRDLKQVARKATTAERRRLEKLVARLASDDPAERDAAQRKLQEFGAEAAAPLERLLAGSTDPEVCLRIENVLRAIARATIPEE